MITWMDRPVDNTSVGDRFIAYATTMFVVRIAIGMHGIRAHALPVSVLDWTIPGYVGAVTKARRGGA